MEVATKTIKTETQLVPSLRFKEFEEEWKYSKVGDLGNFKGGGTPATDTSEYWEGDIPWISSSDVIESDITNLNITRFLTNKAIDESATKIIPKDSVLFVSRVGVGKLAVSKDELCTSQDFANLIPTKDSSYFIAYYFIARNKLLHQYSQGTSIKGFTTGDLKSIHINLPSLPEQQKIASFLSAVDEKIQQLTKKAALLEQYKKGVMQQLFSGQLRFKDENGNPYPDWEETFFADTGKILIGLTHTPEYQPTGRPFLSSKNISGDTIDFENIQYITEEKFQSMPESTKPKRGDILFTRVGSNLGNPKVLEEDIEFGIFVSLGIFRVNEKASNYFMRIWMDSNYFWRQLEQKVAGGAKNNLNTGWLKEFKLNLPSLPEQQKIARYLSSIDTKIEAVGNQITQTQTFKKGLLQQMFV